MTALAALTNLDRRMLAAIRPLDPLGRPVTGTVASAGGARFIAKPDGRIILLSWNGLPAFDGSFEQQPVSPSPGSRTLAIELVPGSRALMARQLDLPLPRSADPANATDPELLFQAAPVIFPASTAFAVPGQASALVVTVLRDTDDAPVGGAVLRLNSADTTSGPALGITDSHGEAMLLLDGLPLASVGAGGQLNAAHDGTLDLFINPATIRTDGTAPPLRDPDALTRGAPTQSAPVTLQARRTNHAIVRWSPP